MSVYQYTMLLDYNFYGTLKKEKLNASNKNADANVRIFTKYNSSLRLGRSIRPVEGNIYSLNTYIEVIVGYIYIVHTHSLS